MVKTIENLKNTFAGESQANRRYFAFAHKAEEEGFPQNAKLFGAAAETETVHALNHLRIMEEVRPTIENAGLATAGETLESKKTSPEYISMLNRKENSMLLGGSRLQIRLSRSMPVFSQKQSKAQNKENLLQVDYYVCGI